MLVHFCVWLCGLQAQVPRDGAKCEPVLLCIVPLENYLDLLEPVGVLTSPQVRR